MQGGAGGLHLLLGRGKKVMEGKASDIVSSDHFLLQTGPQRVLEECLRSAQRKGCLASAFGSGPTNWSHSLHGALLLWRWGMHSKSILVTHPPLEQLKNSSLFPNPSPSAITGLSQLAKVRVQEM